MALLVVNPVAEHDGPVERKTWFRTIPGDRLPNGMSYVRWPLAEVKLLSTAAFDCSRSGRARTRFGAFFAAPNRRCGGNATEPSPLAWRLTTDSVVVLGLEPPRRPGSAVIGVRVRGNQGHRRVAVRR